MRFLPRGITLIYALAAVGLVMVIVSLMGNVVGSFTAEGEIDRFTLGNYPEVIADSELPAVFLRTFALGAGSVVVLLFFALPIAWLITRTDFPWKSWVFVLLTAKLAIPGFITAMAYIWLFNPTAGIVNHMFGATAIGTEPVFDVYQLSWICFIQGIVLTPAAVFMLLPAFRNMDASLEEAALVSGVSRARTARRVVLPLLAPAVIAAALFFFVISIEIFDIAGLIGMPGDIVVFVTWIYDVMHPAVGLPNFGFAGVMGMLLFAMSGIAIVFYIRFLRKSDRYATVGGKSRQFDPQRLGKWRWAALAFFAFWVLTSVVLPVLTLIWVALLPFLQPFSVAALGQLTTEHFLDAIEFMGEPLKNTLILMASVIVISSTLSISITWVVTRSRSEAARWCDMIVFLAPAVPAIVAAVAFQYFGIAIYEFLPLYGSIWLISIAMSTRLLAYCTRTMNAASIQIHLELDEAALASGVSKLRTFRGVFLPIMAPALFYTALMAGMLAARDLTVPLIMNAGQAHTISTLIFDMQTNAAPNGAAAVSLYMIVVLVVLAIFARRIAGISDPGTTSRRRRWFRRGTAPRDMAIAPSPAE